MFFFSSFAAQTCKSPLKMQNGEQESDSPIKKVHKRSRAIIDSDDEDQPMVKEQAPKQSEVQTVKPEKVRIESSWPSTMKTLQYCCRRFCFCVPTPNAQISDVTKAACTPVSPKTPVTPTTPVTSSTSVAVVTPASSGTPATPTSTSPSGIPKRKTGLY